MAVLIFVQSRGNTLGVGASTFGIGSVRLQTELSCLKPRSPLKLESPNFSYGRVCQNQKTRTLVDQSRHAQGIEGQDLDSKTQSAFGSKEMIVLQ